MDRVELQREPGGWGGVKGPGRVQRACEDAPSQLTAEQSHERGKTREHRTESNTVPPGPAAPLTFEPEDAGGRAAPKPQTPCRQRKSS